MRKRCYTSLYRWSLVISSGMLFGQGCITPDTLQRQFFDSFNSAVFRWLEVGVVAFFSQAFSDGGAAV